MIKEKHKNIIKEFISENAQVWICEDWEFLLDRIALDPECDDLTADALEEYLDSRKDCLLHQIWGRTIKRWELSNSGNFANDLEDQRSKRKAEAA